MLRLFITTGEKQNKQRIHFQSFLIFVSYPSRSCLIFHNLSQSDFFAVDFVTEHVLATETQMNANTHVTRMMAKKVHLRAFFPTR